MSLSILPTTSSPPATLSSSVALDRATNPSSTAQTPIRNVNTDDRDTSAAASTSDSSQREIEVSVVMPCLNESETLLTCITEIQDTFAAADIIGEIVVADNGSTDGSIEIARSHGARVIEVKTRGYGSAVAHGFRACRGRYLIMGDADASYAFCHIPRLLEQLRGGSDLVMGNRFQGGIEPGAMPPLHRYLGNPVLTGIGRVLFHSPVGDFHCGLRGIRRDAFDQLELKTLGMEFASEMVIKATLHNLKIAEVPTTLRPDGRSRAPHLRSWRDGWRHLRFMLLFSPRWLFAYTGVFLSVIGTLLVVLLAIFERVPLAEGASLNVNSSIAGAMMAVVGCQLLMSAVFAREFATRIGTHRPSRTLQRFRRFASTESGIISGLVLATLGLAFSLLIIAVVIVQQRFIESEEA